MRGELGIENVINVSLIGLPQGLTTRNVNNIAFFTIEKPNNSDIYRDYISASAVAKDYGTESLTAKMAEAIFAQTPNILSGDGILRIIPMNDAANATPSFLETDDLAPKINDFKNVTNGSIRIKVDLISEFEVNNLDFSKINTVEDIYNILKNALYFIDLELHNTAIVFKSRSCGAASEVVLEPATGGGTDLSSSTFLGGGTAYPLNPSTGETLIEAITRTKDIISYTGIITNLIMEDDKVIETSNFIQSEDFIWVHNFSGIDDLNQIILNIKDASNYKTRCLWYGTDVEAGQLMKAAYVGRAFSVNFSGSSTVQTMNLKSLSTILPDSMMTQTIYDKAQDAGADLYVSYAGVPSVVSNGANLYFDQIYCRTALKFYLESAGFNYLRQTNTKVPQTEQGMIGLKNTYKVALRQFVNNGYIGTNLEWNSSETFGNPTIFKKNIRENGYYVYNIPIAYQPEDERQQRKAPLIQIAIKESGAIHHSDVIVTVEA